MFRKTDTTPQLDMFSTPSTLMCKRAVKKYDDPKSWHNQFFELVTSKINESSFSPLYKEGCMGAPNSSVRVLVAMQILKEGFGCSDEDLFEKCEFDLLTRKALGLFGMDDESPSLATYYNFRHHLCEYAEKYEIDLLKLCFEQITGEQVKLFKISGKAIRMDSKLIGSNIAYYSRYELIHKTLLKVLHNKIAMSKLNPNLRKQAQGWLQEDSAKTVYTADVATISKRIHNLGQFIYLVLNRLPDTAQGYGILHRMFHEQYAVDKSEVLLRDKKEIKSDSLQNPNDPDAAFRNKNGQKVQGYVSNITETTDEAGIPNIITSVQVEPVNHADCFFLEEAVWNAERIIENKVERTYADGAYQSPENRMFATGHDMKLYTGRMQGGCRFILNRHDDRLTVVDTTTGEVINATYVGETKKHGKRWRIPLEDVKQTYPWRYFTEDEVRRSELRKEITGLSIEEQNKRNNVEATMFQYSFHTRNNKTRYKGLLKHRMHAYNRCLWINLRRLVIYIQKTGIDAFSCYNQRINRLIWAFFERMIILTKHHYDHYYKKQILANLMTK